MYECGARQTAAPHLQAPVSEAVRSLIFSPITETFFSKKFH